MSLLQTSAWWTCAELTLRVFSFGLTRGWGEERKCEEGKRLSKGMRERETLQLSSSSSLRSQTCTCPHNGKSPQTVHTSSSTLNSCFLVWTKIKGMGVTPYACLAVCALHMQSLMFYVWGVMQSLCQVLTVGLHFYSDSTGIFPISYFRLCTDIHIDIFHHVTHSKEVSLSVWKKGDPTYTET